MPAGLNPVVVLPVSSPDFHLAVKWLKWVNLLYLHSALSPCKLVVFCAASLPPDKVQELDNLIDERDSWIISSQPVLYERPELGYGAAANSLFIQALEFCEKQFPGDPVLWCESDCIPIYGRWVDRIAEEYEACGKPFMGDFHADSEHPHPTGNGVYPPNWRELAPSMALLPEPRPGQGWDSKCAPEILPQHHRSCRIQQLWTPPRFTAKNLNRVHPETALFHRDKTGTLIDVLAAKLGIPPIPLGAPIAKPNRAPTLAPESSEPVGPRVEIVIVTYKKDEEFLQYCLRSLALRAVNFARINVVVPRHEKGQWDHLPRSTRLIYFDEIPGKGMLGHLIMKSRADELCPEADGILFVDADCMAVTAFTPEDFMPYGKPIIVRERYDEIANPNRRYWQGCVERAMGFKPDFETMCRHPSCHIPAVLKRVRELTEAHTGMKFDDYVLSGQNAFPQSFAELDSFGAVAIKEFSDRYTMIDYDRAQDALECGLDAGANWQYVYRRERDKFVEWWSHAGIAAYRKQMDDVMLGRGAQFYVK